MLFVPGQDGFSPAMVASKAGHPVLAAAIAGGKRDSDQGRGEDWHVPPTPAPSLETQLPSYQQQRPVRMGLQGSC